ncbi:AsnC family transcriptional regulator [Streptomyces sp. H34-S4]|nr:AsnC family transcriptional regulator [Streptomyces sp. H34-S4]MCY0938625.1 AsnC family transcriptional regulator [Streptomyces sp. H34-S4]
MNSAISAIDDTDRALVHALQLAPRASWELLGPVLGARPDTLARRWERLTGSGEAWLSGLGLRSGVTMPCMAWVEVTCTAGSSASVGDVLVADPHALGVEHTTGSRDLLVFVAVPDLPTLYRHLSSRVQRIPGVVGTRTSMVTAVHYAPDHWRLDQLTPGQIGLLTRQTRRPAASASPDRPVVTPLTEEDRPLVLALASDARRSVASLAREFAMSESTVRRRLTRLEAGHSLRYSCALAAGLSGWPVSATLWAEASEYELADCGGRRRAARDPDLHVGQRTLELPDRRPAAHGGRALPVHGGARPSAAGPAHHGLGGVLAGPQVGGTGTGPARTPRTHGRPGHLVRPGAGGRDLSLATSSGLPNSIGPDGI